MSRGKRKNNSSDNKIYSGENGMENKHNPLYIYTHKYIIVKEYVEWPKAAGMLCCV